MFGAHGEDLEALWAPDFSELLAPPPCVTASLQGLDFVSGSRARSRITLGGWDGWMNGGSRSGGPQAYSSADGGFEGDVYEGGRSIRFEGLIVETHATALWQRMDELGSILTAPRYGVLTVVEEHLGMSRQIRVTRLARPMITPLSDRIASYTLELEAADAPRLDTVQQSAVFTAGGVTLGNAGNLRAEVSLLVQGPRTLTRLTGPWGAWEYRGSVPAGQTRVIDMRRRRVRNPATSVHSRADAGGDWLFVPPGGTTVALSGSGTGAVSGVWRSAWA